MSRPDSVVRKRAKLMKKYGPKCQNCGCRIIEIRTLNKFRSMVKKVGRFVSWVSPYGEILKCAVASVEHKTPKSQGGSNSKDNLALWCEQCNFEKSKSDMENFRVHPKGICKTCGESCDPSATKCAKHKMGTFYSGTKRSLN